MWNVSGQPIEIIEANILTRLPDEFRSAQPAKWANAKVASGKAPGFAAGLQPVIRRRLQARFRASFFHRIRRKNSVRVGSCGRSSTSSGRPISAIRPSDT